MTAENIFASWSHINSIRFPFLNELEGTAHHQTQKIKILLWANETLRNFTTNLIKIVTMIIWDVANKMIIPGSPATGASGVSFFCNDDIDASLCCSNRSLHTCNPTADN